MRYLIEHQNYKRYKEITKNDYLNLNFKKFNTNTLQLIRAKFNNDKIDTGDVGDTYIQIDNTDCITYIYSMGEDEYYIKLKRVDNLSIPYKYFICKTVRGIYSCIEDNEDFIHTSICDTIADNISNGELYGDIDLFNLKWEINIDYTDFSESDYEQLSQQVRENYTSGQIFIDEEPIWWSLVKKIIETE